MFRAGATSVTAVQAPSSYHPKVNSGIPTSNHHKSGGSAHEFAAHHCAYRFRRLDCWFTGGRPGRFDTAVVPVCTVLLLELQRLALVPSSSSGCSFPRASWRAWTLAGSISIGRSPAI